jgi:hypothetical protein
MGGKPRVSATETVPTSARNLSAGDSHDRRTEVRNPFWCNVAACEETEPVGLAIKSWFSGEHPESGPHI